MPSKKQSLPASLQPRYMMGQKSRQQEKEDKVKKQVTVDKSLRSAFDEKVREMKNNANKPIQPLGLGKPSDKKVKVTPTPTMKQNNSKEAIETAYKEEAERKAAAEKAKNIAQERGITKTNRINQEREYQRITAKQQAQKAIDAATAKGKKQTQQIKSKQVQSTSHPSSNQGVVKANKVNGQVNQKLTNNTVKNVKNKKLGKSSITTGALSKKKAGKVTTTQVRLKKAFNAVEAMKERRAKAMANRDPSKNPNNVNLRGIVKMKKKGKKG